MVEPKWRPTSGAVAPDERTVLVEYKCVLRRTDKSLLIDFGNVELWVPSSNITSADDPEVGSEDGVVRLVEWFARKNELDYRFPGAR
jgi:hypothetical protein